MRKKIQTGSVLLEVVIATSIFLIVILGLATVASWIVRSSLENVTKIQASYLSEEGLEAVRLMRDSGWSGNIATHASGTPFRIGWTGVTWSATTSTTLIGGIFDRTITLYDVYRDGSQNITSVGGSLDANTKKVTSTVSWNSHGATSTRSLSTYLTNIFVN